MTVSATKPMIRITASDLEGLHSAIVTLMQMFSLFRSEGLVPVVINDQPKCSVRGILLDMNPFGRVPKIVSFDKFYMLLICVLIVYQI